MALTLHELGKTSRAAGLFEAARAYFTRERGYDYGNFFSSETIFLPRIHLSRSSQRYATPHAGGVPSMYGSTKHAGHVLLGTLLVGC